jgi:hypothetical protein
MVVRNLSLNTSIAFSLLLIFNAVAEQWPFFMGVNVAISIVVSYYYFKMLFVGVEHLLIIRPAQNRPFVLFIVVSSALFVTYFVLALWLVYMSFFREFNSAYSDVVLWCFTIQLQWVILVFASSVVFFVTLKNAIGSRAEKKNKLD